MESFFIAMLATLFAGLILAMFCFGPQMLEWLEDMPREPTDTHAA